MRDPSEIAGPPRLGEGRLRLRALRPEDKPAVVAALNDPESARFLWQPPYPYTEADFDEFLSSKAAAWPKEPELFWTVADATDDSVLAAVSLHLDLGSASGEIGYWCAPWARGRGVTTAALRLVRDWAFDDFGVQRLEIGADEDDITSQRVARAAGFLREGVVRGWPSRTGRRDHVLYGMLPVDRRPAPGETAPGDLGWPRLADGRLLVRPFEPADAEAVQAGCDDPDVAHWIYGLPSPYSIRDADSFIADARRRLVAGERARLAVTDAAVGELLGSVSLDLFTGRDAGEMGYWVKRGARRSGVALAAARLVLAWAFDELGLERLELLTYPGNTASQALAGRLGFTREGLLRGYLPAEPGKSRAGRVVQVPGASLPSRDDQVQFARLRSAPA